MATVPSAVSKVFAIPELLEPILIFSALPFSSLEIEHEKKWSKDGGRIKTCIGFETPPKDLVDCFAMSKGIRFILTSALRVNKFWNSVINESIAIQEAVFLKWGGVIYSKEKPTFNPLLVSTFTWGYFHRALPLGEERDKKIRESIIYESASWRRMFPVVPPVKDIIVHQEELTSYWDYDQEGTISLGKDGLHMDLLFDIAEEVTEPADGSTFNLTWLGSVDMSTQPRDIRDYCDTYKLYSSFQVNDFAKPNATLIGKTKTPEDAIAVNRVRILSTKADPRRRYGDSGAQCYPKMKSKGKKWHLNCVEWGEWRRSK